MSIIQKVIDFEREVATNDDHGYDQIKRWGVNFDCSGLGITAWERAGVLVKTAGATYTGDMKRPFLKCGFKDVTSQINLSTGEGLIAGDQCLRIDHHTATCIGRNADGIMEIVQAQSNEKGTTTGGKTGDQTGREIFIKPYYNSLPHWDVILRYPEEDPCLFIIQVLDDTWTHKKPDATVATRDHVVLGTIKHLFGISEVVGTWGRIQNQTIWISINPDYAGVKRVGDVVPPVVPKTITVGSRYTISGTGTGSSDGMGTRVTKTNIAAKCTKIMPGAKNPYGMCWTGGTWVDAWFPASAIK